jgi:hypothetical protein
LRTPSILLYIYILADGAIGRWSVQERQGYLGWINETILSALLSFPLLNDLSLFGDLHGLMVKTTLQGFNHLGGLNKLKLLIRERLDPDLR